MKFAAFVLLAVLGATNASLQDDIQDFISLIPIDGILDIGATHIAENSELLEFTDYMRSDEFRSSSAVVKDSDEWNNFVGHVQESIGLNIPLIMELSSTLLEITRQYNIQSTANLKNKKVANFLDDVFAQIPLVGILKLAEEKRTTSSDFKNLWAQLQSETFQINAKALHDHAEMEKIIEKFTEFGIPMKTFTSVVYDTLEWDRP